MLEFSKPLLDSIVVQSSTDVWLDTVTLHSSPGMGVLAYDCTNVRLHRIRNIPPPTEPAAANGGAAAGRGAWPMAGNADGIHLASCRGDVAVTDCVCDRQGDDGLNIHSQYAVIEAIDVTPDAAGKWTGAGERQLLRVTVGPSGTADNTSWGVVFAAPAFRVNDSVAVRSTSDGLLGVVMTATIAHIQGSISEAPLILTLSAAPVDSAAAGRVMVAVGDILEPASSVPTRVLVSGNIFINSRASGVVMQSNNAIIEGNTVANVSSAGISSGNYFQSFSESPFGSGLVISNNRITNAGLGHTTTEGGSWGAHGGSISILGAYSADDSGIVVRRPRTRG
jgi:hypothetical protein